VLKIAVLGGLAALALVLVPASLAVPPGQQNAGPIKRYVVHGVYTREQRSQLVAAGYDIGEAAWADHVELYGTDAQARRLALHGMRVRRMKPDDFPPPDAGYHNYAEMVDDLQAVAAARKAFDDVGGAWRKMSASERGKVLWRIADLIDKNIEELAELETLNNGKPIFESRYVDMPMVADVFRYFAGWATKIHGETVNSFEPMRM
jgi:hypothetical protein